MAVTIIPRTDASSTFEQLSDSEGRLVLLPASTVGHFRALGIESLTITVGLNPAIPPAPWHSVSDAARMLMDVVSGLAFSSAKSRLSRACDASNIVHRGEGFDRKIEPNSLSSWLMEQRNRDLDRQDDP